MEKNVDIPRGQLSTIILSTLINGDKYGYEIIETIKENTDGNVIIKQPSLYSSLKRMEDQDLISSYWMDSEIGGRRHYYRLTDYGKKQLHNWINADEDIFSPYKNNSNNTKKNDDKNITTTTADDNFSQGTTTILKQENIFDVPKQIPDDDISKQIEKFNDDDNEEPLTDEKFKASAFVQYNLFDQGPKISVSAEYDDGKLLSSEESYFVENKSTTLEKNTVETVAEPTPVKHETALSDENAEKNATSNNTMISDFDVYSVFSSTASQKPTSFSSYITAQKTGNNLANNNIASKTQNVEAVNVEKSLTPQDNIDLANVAEDISEPDEGKLITEHYSEENMPATKFTPAPALEIKSNEYKDILKTTSGNYAKAYKDAIEELYDKSSLNKSLTSDSSKTSSNMGQLENPVFSTYKFVKTTMDTNNIYFDVYKKSDNVNTKSKTHLINEYNYTLFKFLFCLLSIIITNALTFVIVNICSTIYPNQIWLYFLPSIITILYFSVRLGLMHKVKNKKVYICELEKVNIFSKIIFTLIAMLLVYLFNLILGLQTYNFNDYTTTLLLPEFSLLNIPLSTVYGNIVSKTKIINK